MSVASKDGGLWFFEGKMRNLNMEKLCYGLFIWLYLKKKWFMMNGKRQVNSFKNNF